MKIKKSGQWEYLMIIIWLAIGLPILILTIIIAPSNLKKQIETIGTVTHIWVYHHNENSNHTTYAISAIYDCWSKKWIEWDNIGSVSQHYEIGEEITLYCDENEPQRFTLNTPFTEFVLWLWLGLLFSLPRFIMFLIWIKRIKRQNKQGKLNQELKQFGTKVEATIVDINQTEYKRESGIISQIIGQNLWFRDTNKNARFDWKLWFQVTAQYWEDIFISENIYADIYYALDIWDKIDLYIDETDHSKYLIDIDSILEKDYKVLKPAINKKWIEIIFYWVIVLTMSILFVHEKWFDLINLIFFAVAILLLWIWIKRVKRQKQRKKLNQELKQFGTKVEATVLLVLEMTESANKQGYKNENRRILDNSYRIVAKYNKETFLSNKYSGNLDKCIKKWDKIYIYLDNMDHSKYYIDVDSLIKPYSKLFGIKCID